MLNPVVLSSLVQVSLNTNSQYNAFSVHWSNREVKAKATVIDLAALELVFTSPGLFFLQVANTHDFTFGSEVKLLKIKGRYDNNQCQELARIIGAFASKNSTLKILVLKRCTFENLDSIKEVANKRQLLLHHKEEKPDQKIED